MVASVEYLYRSKSTSSNQRWIENSTIKLDYLVSNSDTPTYRQVVYFPVKIDALAEDIKLLSCQLEIQFSPLDFIVQRTHQQYVESAWRTKSGKVEVNLKRPWRIAKVNSYSYGQASIFRIDGDAVSEEATTSGATGAELGGDFYAKDFAVELSGEPNSTQVLLDQQVEALAIDASEHNTFKGQSSQGKTEQSKKVISANHALYSLLIRALPTTPRIGIFQDSKTNILKIEGGEHNQSISIKLGDEFKDQLHSQIAEAINNNDINNGVYWISLALESDTPCQIKLKDFDLQYYLVRRSFDDAQKTTKLQFGGEQNQSLTLPIEFDNLRVRELSVNATTSQKDGLVSLLNSLTYSNQLKGVVLDEWAGSKFTLASAQWVSGISVLLQNLSQTTTVTLEIRSVEGENVSTSLGQSELSLVRLGERNAFRFMFSEPILLDAADYYVLLKTKEGKAALLANSEGETGLVQRYSTNENGQYEKIPTGRDRYLVFEVLKPALEWRLSNSFAVHLGNQEIAFTEGNGEIQIDWQGDRNQPTSLNISSGEKLQLNFSDLELSYSIAETS